MKHRNNPLPPVVTEFYDDEERERYELVEGEGFLPNGIDEERKCELQEAAHYSRIGKIKILANRCVNQGPSRFNLGAKR